MIIDGNVIADDLLRAVAEDIALRKRQPVLTILTSGPNFETKKYLELKCRQAKAVGVRVNIVELPPDVETKDVLDCMEAVAKNTDGLILQLPFPEHIDMTRVLAAVPEAYDVDALGEGGAVHSPVVRACEEILTRRGVAVAGKRVAILGRGRLVGAPAEKWFREMGADVTVVTKNEGNVEHATKDADIIVCGVGQPGIVQPSMVKEGVIILDAGTSEEGGLLRGDADPACAEKASLFTPVPGGIGPVTVAMLFQNLLTLAKGRT